MAKRPYSQRVTQEVLSVSTRSVRTAVHQSSVRPSSGAPAIRCARHQVRPPSGAPAHADRYGCDCQSEPREGRSVKPGVIGQAIGLFAVTNIDDLVVLALFFARGAGHRATTARIAAGQYLGFAAILIAATAAALGATLLPEAAVP